MDARSTDGTQIELDVTARCELVGGEQVVRVYAKGWSGAVYDLTDYVDDDSLEGAREMFAAWSLGAEAEAAVYMRGDVRGSGYVKGAPSTWDEPGYSDHYEDVALVVTSKAGESLDVWDCLPERHQAEIEQGLAEDLALGE